MIEEVFNNKDFEKSDTEIETYESIEKLNYPQEYSSDQPIVVIIDDINQKEMEELRVHSMFKRSRHNVISIFLLSQDYYELSKRTICCNAATVIFIKYSNPTIS